MLQRQNLDGSWLYAYTADGERLLVQDQVNDRQLWTIRDLSGKVLSEYEAVNDTWTLTRDTLYRDGQLLATGAPGELLTHYHLDHLGTPRLLLGPPDSTTTPDPQAAGPNTYLVGRHNYFPFGEEATDSSQNPLRHKFTGHERDQLQTTATTDDLDYMHARYYNPMLGRFLSVDPSQESQDPQLPQSWNRYAYVRNKPLALIDPDGQNPLDFRWVIEAFSPGAHPIHDTATGVARNLDSFMILSTAAAGAATASPEVAAQLSAAFRLAPAQRGRAIEGILGGAAGGQLHRNFPVIDRFLGGVATSVKSLDLGSKTFRNLGRLASRVSGFVEKLANFQGARFAGRTIRTSDINQRILELVVKSPSKEQLKVLNDLTAKAQGQGVTIKIILVE